MPEMKMRKAYTLYEAGGRTFRIGRLSAYDGMYIGYQLLNNALPPVVGALLAGEMGPAAAGGGEPMSKKQFRQLMTDVLSCVGEKLEANKLDGSWTPILAENGTFAVQGLEEDMSLVLALLVQAIKFNFADFFGETLLPILGGALGMKPPDTQPSIQSSTPQ